MTKAAAFKADIDRTLAAVEDANATLQVGDYKEITFRMTKVAAIKAEIDRTLAAVEEANATLQVGDCKKTNRRHSGCPRPLPKLTAP